MVVAKKSSQASKTAQSGTTSKTAVAKSNKNNQPTRVNSGKTSQENADKPPRVSSAKNTPEISLKSTQVNIKKGQPTTKSTQSSKSLHGSKTQTESVLKPDQKDRAIIPKSKIPPSVSNFEEVAQDPLKHILQFTRKRLQNLKTRKDKLHGYQKLLKQGEEVDKKKREALSKYDEVLGSITLAEEFTNLFTFLSLEVAKAKEQLQKEEQERRQKEDLEKAQFSARCLAIFNLLVTNKKIREDFLEGSNSAVKLEQNEMNLLVRFSGLCLPLPYNPGLNAMDKAVKCGTHLNNFRLSSPNKVCDSTYANIRLIFDKVWKSKYFSSLPNFNAISKPKEEEQANEEEKESSSNVETEEVKEEVEEEHVDEMEEVSRDVEERSSSPVSGGQPDTEPGLKPSQLTEEYDEFSTYSMPETQGDNAATVSKSTFDDIQAVIGSVSDPQMQQIQMSFMSFQVDEVPMVMMQKEEPPPPPNHTIEEVLADVQGQYNFLQDSMIDMDDPSNIGVPLSGQVLQPSAGASDAATSGSQNSEGILATQYNPVNEHAMDKDSYMPNGPTSLPDDVSTNHLHHSTASSNMYYVSQDKPDKFSDSKLLSGQESQIKQNDDNLGMGQTTFGSNEPNFNVEIPPSSQYSGGTLHSVDAFQQQSSDISIIKQLPENTFSNSPFSNLHGNSQSPFEGALTANKIPDPIPLPTNPASLTQSLSAADPPTTHIPFPNDKMSGYRSYAGAGSAIDASSAITKSADDNNEQFSGLQEASHQSTILSAGDAVHIPSPVLKMEATPVETIPKEPATQPEESNEMPTSSANPDDKGLAQNTSNRNSHGSGGYQNNSASNYTRGNSGMPRQGQTMGGFYPSRSGNYRPSHNRGYGNFDSMGHPKHFGGSGSGGYQQGGSGVSAPFPSHYNRQDNGMYGGGAQRRGAGGSGRGNRGYPARMNNMRNGGANNGYNRSRTFRPQNSDQVV